jgi:hypothetical protein
VCCVPLSAERSHEDCLKPHHLHLKWGKREETKELGTSITDIGVVDDTTKAQ